MLKLVSIDMSVLKELSWSFSSILNTFFGSDTDLMSQRVKDIMSNPSDKEKYFEALTKIKEYEKEGKPGSVTITLSDNEELTLTT